MAESNKGAVRRSTRQHKPSLKAVESQYVSKLKNSGFVVSLISSDEDEEDLALMDPCTPEKPKLLHEDEIVKGESLFSFQKRKQSASIAQKLQASKTPQAVRAEMKSRLKAVFEDSGSEYELSEEEDSSDSQGSVSDSKYETCTERVVERKGKKANLKPLNLDNVKVSGRGRIIKPNTKYTISSEDYFANSGTKDQTSNNTLDKLETPRLPQYELNKLLSTKTISKEHTTALKQLSNDNQKQFVKWIFTLKQNCSILLYGLGSKESLLTSFHKEHLQDKPVIVVNGFFPSLTMKHILDAISQELFEIKESLSNLNEAVEMIIEESNRTSGVYLLINNIEAIKGVKNHGLLATLASASKIHLVATIDHINGPLVWNHEKLSKFNFVWWDVTSFLPYQHETECKMNLLTQQNSALALSSLKNVFLSLTQNSKEIYLKVAKYQLENYGKYYQGMAFKHLYLACREEFLVSSDLALRAQLTEFTDHKMIKSKRCAESGTEYLVIPIATKLLQKFVEENS